MRNRIPYLFSLLLGLSLCLPHALEAQSFASKQKQKPATLQSLPTLQGVPARAKIPYAQPMALPYQSLPASPKAYLTPNRQSAQALVLNRAEDTGLPLMIRVKGGPASGSLRSPVVIEQAALQQLDQLKSTLQVQAPLQEFQLLTLDQDSLGFTHVKFQQQYRGVPVYGAELWVHFSPHQEVVVNGRYQRSPQLAQVQARWTQAQAEQGVMRDLSLRTTVVSLSPEQQEILDYTQPKTELVIYQVPGYVQRQRLCWHITVRPNLMERWQYFVDANTGEILNRYDHTCSIGPTTAQNQTDLNGQSQTVQVFLAQDNQTYFLLDAAKNMYSGPNNTLPNNGDGFILTADMNNTSVESPTFNEITNNTNSWDAAAVSAHVNAGIAYSYFENTFGHVSINGQSGDIVSFINVAEENGAGMDNAFWNGGAMFYGNGDVAFKPLAGALDVGGHEMGHGVIEATAGLEYQNESGALNEAFADIFGASIEQDHANTPNDWQLGEDVVKAVFPTGALRDMSNPHNGYAAGSNPFNSPGYQPDHVNEQYLGNQNNGGVHINSGIPNHAFYRYATANGMTRLKAQKVFFRALSRYLTRSSKFIDCRLAVVQAATDLHGANSTEVNAAKSAFDAVGILNGNPTPPTQELPTNPGQDFILSVDVNPADPTQVYTSSTGGTNFVSVSQTVPQSKPSISDDGNEAWFIDEDGHIRLLQIGANPSQQAGSIISTNPEWDNVAISKDGTKLAAVSDAIDTAIYVFDLASNPIRAAKYTLYNPTTASGGISTGGVLYADAIEWDYTGQFLVYDAFNRIDNLAGTDIEYWDVGFIEVWDNAFDDFGSGQIFKLFTNLDEGVSIGNGVFSKNSPNIIAFDYFNVTDDDYFLLAADLDLDSVSLVFGNQRLSYPSYSKTDEKIIFNAEATNGNEVIAVIDMLPDKINADPNSNASVLIDVAKWGVWYSVGSRPVGLENFAGDNPLRVFPNPTEGHIQVEFAVARPTQVDIAVFDLVGHQVLPTHQLQVAAGSHAQSLELSTLPAGSYVVQVRAGELMKSVRVLKP